MLVPLAAQVTQVTSRWKSPEALHQRMNTKAMAFLQDMIRQALAKSNLSHCDDGLFTGFTKCISPTVRVLPCLSLQALFPGSGGAPQSWGQNSSGRDSKHSVFDHFALTPWNSPDQVYRDGGRFSSQSGFVALCFRVLKLHALARIADAGSYFAVVSLIKRPS
jgi:hypothetical protein